MAIDTSIYAQANKPQIALADPTDQLSKLATLQTSANANKLFQAQTATGQAAQQAIDPETGLMDQGKLNRLIAANPDAGPNAMQGLQNSQTLATGQTTLQSTRHDQVMQHIIGMLSLPDDQLNGGKPVFDTIDREKASGVIDQPTYDQIRKAMPQPGAPASDFRRALAAGGIGMLPSQQALNAVGTSNVDMPVGDGTQPGQKPGAYNPNNPGVFTPTGPLVRQYLSPGEKALQVAGRNPATGAPGTQPMGSLLPQQGQGDLIRPNGTGGGGAQPMPGAPPTPGAPGTVPSKLLPPNYDGRYGQGPKTQGGAQAPGLTPAPASAPAPATSAYNDTGLAPGVEAEAAQSVAALSDARAKGASFQDRMTPLLQAQEALRANPTSGINSDVRNKLGQLYQQYAYGAGTGFNMGLGSPEQQAAYDIATKDLLQNSRSSGTHTDQDAAQSAKANPSMTMQPQARDAVIRMGVAMQRMEQAKLLSFEASGKTGGQYSKYAAQMSSNIDPRAFMADQQPFAERKAMIQRMTTDEQKKYFASYRLATGTTPEQQQITPMMGAQ